MATLCTVIEEELGCTLKEAFAEITEMPMAAASLGQVRACCLHWIEDTCGLCIDGWGN